MAEKEARGVSEHVPTFQEFYDDEKRYREHVWQQEQARTLPPPPERGWRGWLEGKPNPVLPEDQTPYPRPDKLSESGTDLAAMFPKLEEGVTYPVPDPRFAKRLSTTDRVAAFTPAPDRGNAQCCGEQTPGLIFAASICYLFSLFTTQRRIYECSDCLLCRYKFHTFRDPNILKSIFRHATKCGAGRI